ncbi:MAG: epoxyqueuosine reductase QueH [Proteobacteria bacterium]|nr:epoxyqueuosine reductase QueH [Pseudomonadota bacterium]
MRILLHICCAPCTIYPLRVLRASGDTVSGVFINPNIHPYQEYRKRLETLVVYAGQEELPVIREEGYPMEEFLRQVAFREEERCRSCYALRLTQAAQIAARDRFDAFTTTLLYSRFQKHDLIRDIAESIARTQGIPFLYRDFREGWSEGVRVSKEMGMYRQSYCGCIYSEKERFCRPSRRGCDRSATPGLNVSRS